MRSAALLLLLALVLAAPIAGAHAELGRATPAPNSNVPVGLTEVIVRFTERVDPDATTVDVLETTSGEGRNTAPLEFRDGGYEVRVPVEPLRDGVHTVNWRALSTADGHTTRGSFVFAVGSASLGPNAPPPVTYDATDYDASTIAREGFARAVFFGGIFLAIGMPLFALVVLRDESIPRRVLSTAGTFAILGALGGLVTLLLLADNLGFTFAAASATVAGGGFLRRALLLGGAGVVLLGALALPARAHRAAALLGMAIALVALVSTSAGSHAAAVQERRSLAILNDALHLLMASVWVGGIVAFIHTAPGREPRQLGRMVHRFSPLAIASVVALLATGTYAAFLHMPRVSDLWREPYGRIVAAKVLLMGPLIAIGAYNQRVLGPRLDDGRSAPRYFLRAVQVEAIVMVLVIGLAGALASSAPPSKAGGAGDGGGGFEPPPPTFELTQNTARSHVVLQIRPDPPSVGPSNITVLVHTADLPNGTQVYLLLESPNAAAGDEARLVVLDKVGPQDWAKEDTYFTTSGTWNVTVTIQRGSGFPTERAAFEVPVGAPGTTGTD